MHLFNLSNGPCFQFCAKCGARSSLSGVCEQYYWLCPTCAKNEGDIDDPVIPSKNPRETFMREVYLHASDSKDPRTKIGAVLTIDDRLISTGFNGFPRKVKDYRKRYDDRETKYKFICHAEANSVSTAARLGRATLGTTLYTQGIPCQECCKALIQAGVKRFIVHKQWPNLTYSEKWNEAVAISTIMMEEAGIELEIYDKILGVKGFLDGKEIEV